MKSVWRCWFFSVCLLATPVLAQQAIQPAVFTALTQAQQAQQQGDLAGAQRLLNSALGQSRDGSLEQALLEQRLAYLAVAGEDWNQAVRWFERALSRNQLEPAAAAQDRRNLAQLLAQVGRYRDAATLLERELQAGSLDLDGKRLLVQVWSRQQQYRKAIPLAEQVVRADPRIDSVWYQLLVGMNHQEKRYREAERWLQVLLQREPGKPEHWRQLAALRSLDGRQREAAAALRLAQLGGLGLSDADLDNLIALQVRAGAPWQAASLLEQLLAQGVLAGNPQRSEQLAGLWQRARERQRAINSWQSLAERSGQSRHWLQVAGLQVEQEDWPAALRSLSRAENGASAEQLRQIRLWQGYARYALGELDAARQSLRQVSGNNPQAREAGRLLAWLEQQAAAQKL